VHKSKYLFACAIVDPKSRLQLTVLPLTPALVPVVDGRGTRFPKMNVTGQLRNLRFANSFAQMTLSARSKGANVEHRSEQGRRQ